MLVQEYEIFLSKQKAEWLDKKVNKGKLSEANERYGQLNWLKKAIKNARYAIATHTSTFTHSDAKSTPILFKKERVDNGYLVSNNIVTEQFFDVFGNAATDTIVKETYLFLETKLSDGNTIGWHFENETEYAKVFLSTFSQDSENVKSSFRKIFVNLEPVRTTGLLKQVYFPVKENNYHLLSILSSSIAITEIVKRIDAIKFSEITKEAKESRRKSEYHETGFSELYDITQIGLGGSKPQNISVLNSQNAGRSYLLSSVPPTLEKRSIRLPKTDFFAQCLYRNNFQESYIHLHKLMQLDINNINVRTAIRNIIQFLIDQVLLAAFRIRQYEAGWSNADYYAGLPLIQRIWLDEINIDKRVENDDWRDELSKEIARWILRSYEHVIQGAYILGHGELLEVRKKVEEVLKQDKEFF